MASRPVQTLLALSALTAAPLLGVRLAMAQSAAPEAAPSVLTPPAAPAPDPVPQPASAAPPPSPPLVPSPSASVAPPPLRPGPEVRQPQPGAARFDDRLDALVREGIVSPRERIRVRGTFQPSFNAEVRDQACRSGALSARECSTGLVFRGRGENPAPPGVNGGEAGPGGERYGIAASPLPPISVPVTALLSGAGGSFRLTDVFRVTPRPAPTGGNGNARLLYPLIGSAVTTSGFGWRLHPVIGSWLMHSGRDLAAPEGTPVVAALSGRVVSSGLAGGYGLAVEIEHEGPRRRTLYGHLSELYVKEGETVRQGEVIGRVGSTGLSTGPHLHFELRLPQDGGWVATDPGDLDPGGPLLAAGQPAIAAGTADAVALLMGQLVQTLERPRSPLGPVAPRPAAPAAAAAPPRG